ncbi:hypothetical protein ACEPAI_3550 [Sanghuangporus weigelae]
MAQNLLEVRGILSAASKPGHITAEFATASGDTHTYKSSSAITTIIGAFTSEDATLTYSDEADLEGNCAITGFINRDAFDFLMYKGARIKGRIQQGDVPWGSEIPVHGFGTWSSPTTPNQLVTNVAPE